MRLPAMRHRRTGVRRTTALSAAVHTRHVLQPVHGDIFASINWIREATGLWLGVERVRERHGGARVVRELAERDHLVRDMLGIDGFVIDGHRLEEVGRAHVVRGESLEVASLDLLLDLRRVRVASVHAVGVGSRVGAERPGTRARPRSCAVGRVSRLWHRLIQICETAARRGCGILSMWRCSGRNGGRSSGRGRGRCARSFGSAVCCAAYAHPRVCDRVIHVQHSGSGRGRGMPHAPAEMVCGTGARVCGRGGGGGGVGACALSARHGGVFGCARTGCVEGSGRRQSSADGRPEDRKVKGVWYTVSTRRLPAAVKKVSVI